MFHSQKPGKGESTELSRSDCWGMNEREVKVETFSTFSTLHLLQVGEGCVFLQCLKIPHVLLSPLIPMFTQVALTATPWKNTYYFYLLLSGWGWTMTYFWLVDCLLFKGLRDCRIVVLHRSNFGKWFKAFFLIFLFHFGFTFLFRYVVTRWEEREMDTEREWERDERAAFLWNNQQGGLILAHCSDFGLLRGKQMWKSRRKHTTKFLFHFTLSSSKVM